MHAIHIGRIYDSADETRGRRVLVDRIWPRGVRKADAQLDEWLKNVAPTTQLRKWYGHDPKRYDEFARLYRDELEDEDHADSLARLKEWLADEPVTLLTASKNTGQSHVPIIVSALKG